MDELDQRVRDLEAERLRPVPPPPPRPDPDAAARLADLGEASAALRASARRSGDS
ncbi:MAG: hypothetical protein ACRDQA_00285 [Nocardioidaceae bacterium]